MIRQRLAELVTNPANGRLSTSDTIVIGAFTATTLVLVWCGLTGHLDEWLWLGYLGAWVTQSQASKWQALNRDRTKPDHEKNFNAD